MNKVLISHFLIAAFSLLGIISELPAGETDIGINEIMYNPSASNTGGEFVEIYNRGSTAVNASGWKLEDSTQVMFTLPGGTIIAAGGYLVFYDDAEAIAFYGLNTSISYGPYTGGLDGSGERIALKNAGGTVIDEVTYDDNGPWPSEADGNGPSLELWDPTWDNNNGGSWGFGQPYSPGTPNSPAASCGGDIVITEIMYNPQKWRYMETFNPFWTPYAPYYWQDGDDPDGEYIELYNRSMGTIDLTGWQLWDEEGILYEFAGQLLSANSYLAVCSHAAAVTAHYGIANAAGNFARSGDQLSNGGEQILLKNNLGFMVDTVRYRDEPPWPIGPDQTGQSLECLDPDSDNHQPGNWRTCRMSFDAVDMADSFPVNPSVGDEYFPPLGTPGSANSVSSTGLPPFVDVEKIVHSPATPTSSDPVTVTAKVTSMETIAAVTLHYETFNKPYQVPSQIQTLAMYDDGSHGDGLAGDGIYGAAIPAMDSQTLVRYRVTATDSSARSWTWPDEGEPNPNKAYFVYDHEIISNASCYFLIIPEENYDYLLANIWSHNYVEAALVAEGIVYDHVGIHLRGQGWRDQPKKGWKIAFNKTEYLRELSSLDLVMHMPVQQKAVHDLFWSLGQGNLATEVVRYYINGDFYGVFMAEESLSASSLKRRGMDEEGEIYKANAIDWPYGTHQFSSALDYYDPALYPGVYPKLYEKKSDAFGSFQSLIDLTYLFARTPENEITSAMENTVDLDQWLYKWAINVCGPNFDIMGSNYTLIHPAEPEAKWQWISHDYTHYFASAHNLDPYAYNYANYYNYWQERVMANPALNNRFLVILDDLLKNYDIVQDLCSRLDEEYEKYEADLSDEIDLHYEAYPNSWGPFVLSYSQKESIKASFAARCNWLKNTWLAGKSYTLPANQHPLITLNEPMGLGDTIRIAWSYQDAESDACTVDLYWTDLKWSYMVPIADANDIPAEQGSFLWSHNLPDDYLSGDIYIHAVIRDGQSDLVGHNTCWKPVFIPENCQTMQEHGYGLPGDVNQDCHVDLADVAALAANWTANNKPSENPAVNRWDFWEDLAFTSNPNGPWSYGHSPRATNRAQPNTGSLTLFTHNIKGYSGVPCPWWHFLSIMPGMVPAVYKNTTTADVYGCPPGMAALHNGYGVEYLCVARWTAPAAGTYIVRGAFYSGNVGRCDYYIIRNYTSLLFSRLDTGGTSSFDFFVEVNAGDTIDFTVGAGTDGGGSDTTPLEAAIEIPTCENIGIYFDGDLNKDCVINLQDLGLIASDWLQCNDPTDSNCSLAW